MGREEKEKYGVLFGETPEEYQGKGRRKNQLRNGAISDAGNGVMKIGDLGIN